MSNVTIVALQIERHLQAIGDLFKPGAKITLLVRQDIPDRDADLVMTIDELPLAIAALQRRHDLQVVSS